MFDLGAITLGLHLVSAHLPDDGHRQNINPGIYIMAENGLTAGILRNSVNRATAYVGGSKEWGRFSVMAGVQFYQSPGYSQELRITKSSQFLPIVAGSVSLPAGLRLSFLPGGCGMASVVHLSVEKKW